MNFFSWRFDVMFALKFIAEVIVDLFAAFLVRFWFLIFRHTCIFFYFQKLVIVF